MTFHWVAVSPWTVTCSSLRVLCGVAAFCQPVRPVFLLVSRSRSWSPVVGTLGLVLVGVGVVLRFLLPTPLRTQVVHHMPRRVSVCVRPNTSTPPSSFLVVHHAPPRHAGLHVGRKPPTTLRVACASRVACTPLWRARGACAPAQCPGWFTLHGGCAGVLGSAHPDFVTGSLPFLHHPDGQPPLCDIPSGCCFFTGPWTVTRPSLRCAGSLRFVGPCGLCSCWCCFRVRGAPSLVYWGCAGCGRCGLSVSGAQ